MVENILKGWLAYPGVVWDVSLEKFAASLNLTNIYPEVARIHHTYVRGSRIVLNSSLLEYLSLTTDISSQSLYYENMILASGVNTSFRDIDEYTKDSYEHLVLSWFKVIENLHSL